MKCLEVTVTLYPIRFRRAALDAAPVEERLLYLRLGQLGNEINMLRCQFLVALRCAGRDAPTMEAGGAIALLNARILAGRLFEAWELCNRNRVALRAFKSAPEAKTAWKRIARYFSDEKNIIERIRHEVAFHNDDQLAASAYELIQDDDEFAEYISEHRGSCLFGSAQALTTLMMVVVADKGDRATALDKIMDDLIFVGRAFEEYIHAVALAFALKYLNPDWDKVRGEPLEVERPPRLDDCLPPFFFEPDTLPGD